VEIARVYVNREFFDNFQILGGVEWRYVYFQATRLTRRIGHPSPVGGELSIMDRRGRVQKQARFLVAHHLGAASDLNGANEVRVIDASGYERFRLCGKQVCVMDTSSLPSAHFIRYDPATKRREIKPLDVGPRAKYSSGMDVSPDGRWVIYTRAETIESDILMVENFH